MKITNFEHTGLDKIGDWLDKHLNGVDEKQLRELLKTANVHFVAEGINRLHSTLLCECDDSYVQQSQRYVSIKDDGYLLPELHTEYKDEAVNLTKKAFNLYERMSELTDEFKNSPAKRRPVAGDYKYGIPIEDARYILPLSCKTNVSVSMSGDKLCTLFDLMNTLKYGDLFSEFKSNLLNAMRDASISVSLRIYLDRIKNSNMNILNDFYDDYFNKITSENNMVLIDSFKSLNINAGLGALTSSQDKSPSEILEKWGENAECKATDTALRVMGYGHTSISEQGRTTFGLMLSLTAYHQFLRHRLPKNYREPLLNIVVDKKRPVVVPDTIKSSIFYNEYLSLTEEFKEFRYKLYKCFIDKPKLESDYSREDIILSFLLNCDKIKVVSGTNARIDSYMLGERLCMNAQWEIRELMTKKFMILRTLSNILYESALPSCLKGKCREGKLSCGKQDLMKKKFFIKK